MHKALGFGFVLAVTALSWFSMPAATVAICASVLVALQGKASTLVELSFGPLKAKLQRDVTEAEKLVAKLRSMAIIQAKATNAAIVRTGRFAENSDWRYLQLRTTEAALRALGVEEPLIADARAEFVRFVAFDLGAGAMGGPSRLPLELQQPGLSDWYAVMNKEQSMTPDDVQAFLTKWDKLSPARLERVNDMRWVLDHGDIRDREQYLRSIIALEWKPADFEQLTTA